MKDGKIGFYPVTNAQEWDELPALYKAMEWFPIEVFNSRLGAREKTVAEYVEFDVIYMEPYKIRATVKVHVEEVQKILSCYFEGAQCHLYTISGVVFQNGERVGAEWKQDRRTGAFEICDYSGRVIGKQGGFRGFVPNQIEVTEDGYKWKGFVDGNRCHYAISNPYR